MGAEVSELGCVSIGRGGGVYVRGEETLPYMHMALPGSEEKKTWKKNTPEQAEARER